MQKKEAASPQPAASQPAATSQPAAGKPAEATSPRVVMETSMGKIVIELYPDKAPITVENFLKYVDSGFYGGTIFHRVIPGFMIQGGGFAADMQQKKTQAPIQNEAKNGLKNVRGAIAMARTGDPNSATAQFFIDVADHPNLDCPRPDGYGYAVFGKVIEGMDVADKIVNTPTRTVGPFENVPKTPVTIQSVTHQ
jgi:peptidyl-prolyl cis-trans isomerase A (cyclophilin A)